MMRRRLAGRVVVVFVVAALSAAAVAEPTGAQEGEPRGGGVEIITDEASDSDTMPTDLGFVVRATEEGFGSYTVLVSSGGRRRDIASGPSLDQIAERVDPCDYRSDLPGTPFTVTVQDSTVVATQVLILGADTTKPKFLDPTSSPPPDSQVEAGDRIRFEVTATDKNARNTSWQTGVRTLQVTGPQGLIDDAAAGRLPKPATRSPRASPWRIPTGCGGATPR